MVERRRVEYDQNHGNRGRGYPVFNELDPPLTVGEEILLYTEADPLDDGGELTWDATVISVSDKFPIAYVSIDMKDGSW